MTMIMKNMAKCYGKPSRYASNGARKNKQTLHRRIMDATKNECVDHRDGNTLNCQKSNLRKCTKAQNRRNSPPRCQSGFKGVRIVRSDKYYAAIDINGRTKTIGSADTAEGAARIYDAKALELWGEFAWLNFPPKGWIQNQQKNVIAA